MRPTNPAQEEKRIASLTANLVRLCEKRSAPCFSDFLSENEQLISQRTLGTPYGCEYAFFGGYGAAQRKMLCVYPSYCEISDSDYPLTQLNLKFRKTAALTHRDFLGALMALGLKREAVGDIVIEEGRATFFVKSELAPYVTSQLEKVGREGAAFTSDGADLSSITQKFDEKTAAVSSLRLDAIVGECTGLSRSKAQQSVKSGLVAADAQIIYDTDHRVSDGAKISVRGFGKYIVHFDGSMSKKGKYRIIILKYL